MTGKGLDPLPVGSMPVDPRQTTQNTAKNCKSTLEQTPQAQGTPPLRLLWCSEASAFESLSSEKLNNINDRQAFGASPPVTAFPPPSRLCAQ